MEWIDPLPERRVDHARSITVAGCVIAAFAAGSLASAAMYFAGRRAGRP